MGITSILGGLVSAEQEWGLWKGRIGSLVILLILASFTIIYLRLAKTRTLFIRKLPALDAVDEAIGRATEMGRPVSYVPGLGGIDALETMCGMVILGEVATRCANLDTKLIVLNRNVLVQPATAGIVRDAYKAAGKAEKFTEETVRYIAPDQFAFAAGALGIFKREKPAANMLIGRFWAESLELAEVGNEVGAIQIAGSSSMAQVPFLVAATDYCLIGEELYAAAAYIGHDPVLTGSIAGQDWGKVLALILMVVGVISAWVAAGDMWLKNLLYI